MRLDFSAALSLSVIITGIIWLLDVIYFSQRRKEKHISEEKISYEPVIVEWSRSLFPILFIVLFLRSFIVEPFKIPSGSMMPTLLVGDFILVNKFTYGIRLPVLHKKVIEIDKPKRGDVVVFRYPQDPSIDYIKRVIGLPGDKVGYYDKVLYINGERIPQERIGDYIGIGSGFRNTGSSHIKENLMTVEHEILIDPRRPPEPYENIVPEGHYFVMGDNRDKSNDSRYWGYVPESHLVGRAFLIWMNWDSANGGPSWGRIGGSIK